MTYTEAKALIKHYWHMSGVLGGLDENMMIRELVRKQARIQELQAWKDAVPVDVIHYVAFRGKLSAGDQNVILDWCKAIGLPPSPRNKRHQFPAPEDMAKSNDKANYPREDV